MRRTKSFGTIIIVFVAVVSLLFGYGTWSSHVSARKAEDDEEASHEIDMKNFFTIKAPGYTQLENIKTENNFDGTYYYEDMTSDGLTIITNMSAQTTIRDAQKPDAYAINFVCEYVDNDAIVTDCVQDEKLTEKMVYPVYKITWEKGSNEDSRQAVGVVIKTDLYTYYFGYSCPLDYFEDNADFYNEELDGIEWLELEE